MSEHALVQTQQAKTSQPATKEAAFLQHREWEQADESILEHWQNNSVASTFVEPNIGFDFSRVPAFTAMARQNRPMLRTQPMVQRTPKDGASGSSCLTCPEAESAPTSASAEPTMDATTPTPEAAQTPVSDEPTEETATPEETASPRLLVEDSATELAPGQMKKSEFLSQLRAEVCRSVEAALAGTGRTTDDCPYLTYWFDFYSSKDSAHIERAIHRYAPDASSVTTVSGYISVITQRARQAAETWARTGEITGVPEGVPTTVPGEAPAESGEGAATATSPVMFKAREGGARATDDPQAIQAELGDGLPLDSTVRSRMESAFGMDFAHVRTHTDTTAAGLSNRLNARAFTVGQNVAFGAGEYKPGTPIGDALIAHELAHVVQQSGASDSVALLQTRDTGYDTLEADADRSAVGAVAALWDGAKGTLAGIVQNAIPRLRSGLRLSRCKSESSRGSSATATTTTPCRPTFRSLEAVKTGSIAMTTAWSGSCEMAFGTPGSPGMTYNSEVSVPSGCTGTLEYLQLIDRCLEKREAATGNYKRRKSGGYVLDGSDPYASKGVTSSGRVTFSSNDSPGAGAAGWNYMFITDRFKMWLLWTPNSPSGSPRVPLGMVEWNWTAKTNKTGAAGCAPAWTISDDSANGGTGALTTTMPTWSKTYPADIPYELGRC